MDHPENIVTQLIQEEHRSKWVARSNHNVKCFTEDEIKRFTNNYETILGRGSFGEVYKGVLVDKSMVAVKRFVYNEKENFANVRQNFAKELTVHSEINHKNVVRLVGYCVDENALMVVTEYIQSGNLSNILHHDRTPVGLDTRLRIAIECAEALGYMHSQMYTRVIHGDIKPANILLDNGLRAKVADFGISRLVNTENTLYTLNVIGSIGYMDPLFAQNGRLTTKSDVYSFGVVLLELITRKKARDDGGGIGLVERFTQARAKGTRRVREMFDAEIAIPNNIKTIEEIAKLSGKCLKMELHKRPEMLEVAECLRKLRKASHQGRERPALFSWGRKTKLAPAATPQWQENSSSSHNVGNAVPAESTPSQESSSSCHDMGIAAPAELTTSQESSSSSHYVEIAAPAESTTSQESSGSNHYVATTALAESTTSQGSSSSRNHVGIATPAESATSQKSSNGMKNVGTFTAWSTMTTLFDLEDLMRSSAEVLGKGTCGTTYKATLETGYILVCKRLSGTKYISNEEFFMCVAEIGAIQNKHIAPLQWYYRSYHERLVLYDFFPMGSLTHALHVSTAPLDWEQRLAIALAVALGVAYIHSRCMLTGTSCCHGNIKSSNVMLTGTHDACVSEHGLTALGTIPGASGYSAPEITSDKWASQEADVYSFGILLLELLAGKDPMKNTQLEDGVNLSRWVHSVAKHEWTAKVIDVQLQAQQQLDGVKECMVRLLQLAVDCCSEDANSRTTMSDVVQRIEKMQTSQESSSSSHHVGNAVPAESTTSQESSRNMKNDGTFIIGSTMTSSFVLEDLVGGSTEFLGEGTAGETYKVTTESGYTVVIKSLRAVDLPKEEFDLRVSTIGAIQNKYMTPLQWYYCSNDKRLLVYDFFQMGSLANTLHGHSGYRPRLGERVAMALDVARGVAYIHYAGPSICHGNIKSSNIMLTDTHDACLSEHGLAALGPFPGYSGYSAPEIINDKWVSQKADVFSFGILLLELLTGKDPMKNTQLEAWVCSVAKDMGSLAVIDSQLLAQQQSTREEDCMLILLHLAICCCRHNADCRPTMSVVVQRIENMQT